MDWNPRYVVYASSNGRSPEEQFERDKIDNPGACMMPFVFWNNAQLREFADAHPESFLLDSLVDHDAYDAWLRARS